MFSLLFSKNRLTKGCEAGEQEALAGARIRPASIKARTPMANKWKAGSREV
jgi:hypothetical protein